MQGILSPNASITVQRALGESLEKKLAFQDLVTKQPAKPTCLGGSRVSLMQTKKNEEEGDGSSPLTKRKRTSYEQGDTNVFPGWLISFWGKSATSTVPATFYCSKVSESKLHELREIFLPMVRAKPWSKNYVDCKGRVYRQRQIFFRLSKEAPKRDSNGGSWKALGSAAAQHWWKQLQAENKVFYECLERDCRDVQYDTDEGPKNVFEVLKRDFFAHNIFVYASVQERRWYDQQRKKSATRGGVNTYDYGTWHCDGGPSTIFLAVSLDGCRSLEIETVDKEVFRQRLEPGSFYVSSPSSFWHTVEPVIPDAGHSGSQTSLVVRSAVLLKRISGGRAKVNEDGQIERTNGMIYGTRRGFEDLSKRVSDIMQNVFSEVGFRL